MRSLLGIGSYDGGVPDLAEEQFTESSELRTVQLMWVLVWGQKPENEQVGRDGVDKRVQVLMARLENLDFWHLKIEDKCLCSSVEWTSSWFELVIGWGESSVLRLLIEMLISSENTPTEFPVRDCVFERKITNKMVKCILFDHQGLLFILKYFRVGEASISVVLCICLVIF